MIFWITLIAFFTVVRTDICNYHATLTENDAFYLTQPFIKNISINIMNYDKAFSTLSSLLPRFQNILHTYETDDSIKQTEPVRLTEYNNQHNVYPINTTTVARLAFNSCTANGGSLITLNPHNRLQVASIMKELQMDTTPVKVLPLHSIFSVPDLEILDTPHANYLQYSYKSPPIFTKENTFKYPDKSKTTTAGSVAIDSTADDYASKILCMKPNNPWDLPTNRRSWIHLLPLIKTSISLLDRLRTSYDQSSRSLKSLPQTVFKQTANFFKLNLPEPFKFILEFLDNFSSKRNWEKTDMSHLDKFKQFAQVALKLVRHFNMDSHSITKMDTQQVPIFKPMDIDELNWKDLFGLNEEVYGISGPIVIRPQETYVDEAPSANNLINFKATVRARVYNRNLDLVKILTVRPNVLKNKITTVRQMVQTSKFALAINDVISPVDCHQSPNELYKICHKLPYQSPDNVHVNDMLKCAQALLNTNSSSDYSYCPQETMGSRPMIYRADCDNDGHSTLILNSKDNLKLNFICDAKQTLTKDFITFPATVKTDCEVQLADSELTKAGLPQFNPDFLQDPIVGPIETLQTTEVKTNDQTMLILFTTLLSIVGVSLIIALSLLTYYLCKCRCTVEPQQQPPLVPNYYPVVQLNDFFGN